MEAVAEDSLRAQVSPYGGGMDWLEVRIPTVIPWRPEVAEVVAETRRKPEAARDAAPR